MPRVGSLRACLGERKGLGVLGARRERVRTGQCSKDRRAHRVDAQVGA